MAALSSVCDDEGSTQSVNPHRVVCRDGLFRVLVAPHTRGDLT